MHLPKARDGLPAPPGTSSSTAAFHDIQEVLEQRACILLDMITIRAASIIGLTNMHDRRMLEPKKSGKARGSMR